MMKKFIFFLAFFSYSINASVIIGSPNVEINPEGLYLVKIKISSNNSITAVSYTHLTLPTKRIV